MHNQNNNRTDILDKTYRKLFKQESLQLRIKNSNRLSEMDVQMELIPKARTRLGEKSIIKRFTVCPLYKKKELWSPADDSYLEKKSEEELLACKGAATPCNFSFNLSRNALRDQLRRRSLFAKSCA